MIKHTGNIGTLVTLFVAVFLLASCKKVVKIPSFVAPGISSTVELIEVENEITVGKLSGCVALSTGERMRDVKVQLIDKDKKQVISTKYTNRKGEFSFGGAKGAYLIKISLEGFNTVIYHVKTSSSSHEKLVLVMGAS